MKHCYNYEFVSTKEGIPIFVIEPTQLVIKSPVLLYDGGKHATLFSDERLCETSYTGSLTGRQIDFSGNQAVLVDYLPDDACLLLKNSTWVVFMEREKNSTDILRDYKVAVRHVSRNNLIDNLPNNLRF